MEQWGVTARSRDIVDRVCRHVRVDRGIQPHLPWASDLLRTDPTFPLLTTEPIYNDLKLIHNALKPIHNDLQPIYNDPQSIYND